MLQILGTWDLHSGVDETDPDMFWFVYTQLESCWIGAVSEMQTVYEIQHTQAYLALWFKTDLPVRSPVVAEWQQVQLFLHPCALNPMLFDSL